MGVRLSLNKILLGFYHQLYQNKGTREIYFQVILERSHFINIMTDK